MKNLRPTRYENSPAQTQSFGRHDIRLPLAELFDQATKLTLADAVELLVCKAGTHQTEVRALLRKCELEIKQITAVKRLEMLLPAMPQLDFKLLAGSVEFVEDLLNDAGLWRQKFEGAIAMQIDQQVIKVFARLQLLANETANQFGFETAIQTLFGLSRALELEANRDSTGDWQARDVARLQDAAESLGSFASLSAQKNALVKKFRPQFSKEDRADIAQHHEVAQETTNKRREQLRREVAKAVIGRLLDKSVNGSLPNLIVDLEVKAKKLRELAEAIRETAMKPKNSVTETYLVREVREPIDGHTTLFPAFQSSFQQAGCSTNNVVAQLRAGIELGGQTIRPEMLAAMPTTAACQALIEFSGEFFFRSLEHVLNIDLSRPELQLRLANITVMLVRKSQPFLTFKKFGGGVEKYERYLFSHPVVRPLIEKYCRGRVHFSNHADDQRFTLESAHVVSLTCAVLGPGHGRLDYLRGLYRRSQLIGKSEFLSIYPPPSTASRPLAIAERPDSSEDCEQLFELGNEIAAITSQKINGDDRFICCPLDETIRHRFSKKRYRRRPFSGAYLRRLLNADWFVDYASSTIPSLSQDWHENIAAKIDLLSDHEIGDELVQLGVLQKARSVYLFGRRHDQSMPRQEFLFADHHDKPMRIPRADFLDAMYQHDDLYTRVLFDVVLAEAGGRLSLNRLPAFAKELVLKLRD